MVMADDVHGRRLFIGTLVLILRQAPSMTVAWTALPTEMQ